uniref:BolA-like protein n=1 Tax=Timspurckia oligopyrenoides TaxID=708627 RepID=A0A7S0ZFH7_9RHOD
MFGKSCLGFTGSPYVFVQRLYGPSRHQGVIRHVHVTVSPFSVESRKPRSRFSQAVRMCSAPPGDTLVQQVEKKISALLDPVSLSVTPAYDDPNGSHVTIDVVSSKFEGLMMVRRQQLVYKAIWDEMNSGAIHAVDSMTTKTPKEAGM